MVKLVLKFVLEYLIFIAAKLGISVGTNVANQLSAKLIEDREILFKKVVSSFIKALGISKNAKLNACFFC